MYLRGTTRRGNKGRVQVVKSSAFMDMDECMHYSLPLTFLPEVDLFVGSSSREPPVRFLPDVGDASHPDVDGDLLPVKHLGQHYLSTAEDQLAVDYFLDLALHLLVWQ